VNINKVFSTNLSRVRNNLKWTQSDLAKRAGISQDWVSHFECGRRLPSLPVLLKLSNALGASLDTFFEKL
jgi:transcriptional regulator with XRE-family HTH domain